MPEPRDTLLALRERLEAKRDEFSDAEPASDLGRAKYVGRLLGIELALDYIRDALGEES